MTRHTMIRGLYLHMEWADAAVWSAVFRTPGASTDEKIRKYLWHLHVAQRGFLRLCRGEPRDAPYPEFSDPPVFLGWVKEYYPLAMQFLDDASVKDPDSPLDVPWAEAVARKLGKTPGTSTLGEVLIQAALHSLYHRGQINARLRELGGDPPLVDFIAWVWIGKPAAEWPR